MPNQPLSHNTTSQPASLTTTTEKLDSPPILNLESVLEQLRFIRTQLLSLHPLLQQSVREQPKSYFNREILDLLSLETRGLHREVDRLQDLLAVVVSLCTISDPKSQKVPTTFTSESAAAL